MFKKIILKEIVFNNFKHQDFSKIILKKGYYTFPSAPGLASILENKKYHKSLINSDLVFFDSGFFVILLKFFKNINVIKFSGFKFLQLFFKYLKKNNKKIIFCIDPNKKFSISNKKYLENLKIKKVYSYVAPHYNSQNIKDSKLVKIINTIKPDFVLNNLGGGTQEILALYLKKKMKIKSTILCTGGAISFFTGDQAPINNLVDRIYMGWFLRLIYNPSIFIKRYLQALKLIPIVMNNEVKISNE